MHMLYVFKIISVRSIPTKALFESPSMSRPTQRGGDAVICRQRKTMGEVNSETSEGIPVFFGHGAWNFNLCVL